MFQLNQSNRQYLNLSTYADGVLRSDMAAFDPEQSKSGFLNRVIRRFFREADASISLRLKEREQELEAMFRQIPAENAEPSFTDRLTEMLLAEYEQALIRKREYPKEVNVGWDFRLDDENAWWIYRSGSLSGEEAYYRRGSDYVKAVLEEYARLTFYEREAVYYNEEIRKIDEIIRDRRMLRITTAGRVFEVKAYGILPDEQDRFHYLVGCSRPYHSTEPEIIASFRLSRIDHSQTRGLSPNNNRSGRLTKKERLAVENTIHDRGVMYLMDPRKTVYLKMGQAGMDRYERKLTNRPLLERQEGGVPGRENVYRCFGTERQIENYFFDFGEDVEILAPEGLREKFAVRYRKAAGLYDGRKD